MAKLLLLFVCILSNTVWAQSSSCDPISLVTALTSSYTASQSLKIDKVREEKAKNQAQWTYDYARYQTLVSFGEAVAGHDVTEASAKVASDARDNERWQTLLTMALAEASLPMDPPRLLSLQAAQVELNLSEGQQHLADLAVDDAQTRAHEAEAHYTTWQSLAGIVAGKEIVLAKFLMEQAHFDVRLATLSQLEARLTAAMALVKRDYVMSCKTSSH